MAGSICRSNDGVSNGVARIQLEATTVGGDQSLILWILGKIWPQCQNSEANWLREYHWPWVGASTTLNHVKGDIFGPC